MSDVGRTDQAELPRVVDWTEITLTHLCNQRCFFCYEDARNNATQPELERVKELLRATAKQAEQVVLCGKEVLMRRDVPEIVSYAASIGLKPVVFTNGQALARPGLVEELARAGCAGLAVSFHFPDRETFARGARVSAKGFDLILAGLRRVRDYNLAHPERPLSISTESDLFALNVGRLAEMRDTLREALEGAPWRMRLASLLPTRSHDIGLQHILDPLAARREEIAAFIESQPEHIPLGFVKIPLCLLPQGHEYRSLDAQYVYEGTRLTFNHAEADRISLDTVSASISRDLAGVLGAHPYRWVCRPCSLAPMCRFERVDWTEAGFGPDRDQRPTPYRSPGGTPAVVDRLTLERRSACAAQVLAPLGSDRDGIERVEILGRFLEGLRYPEEEILAALADADPGAPQLIDAWAEGPPVLEIRLRVGTTEIDLHLGVPTLRTPHTLVGYLDVRPVGDDVPDPQVWLSCLRHLHSLSLPALDRWQEDTWFDAYLGRVFAGVSRRLGEALWPGVGGIGTFRTTGLSLSESRVLTVELEGPEGLRASIVAQGGKSAADEIGLKLTIEAEAKADAISAQPVALLLEALGIAAPTDLAAWRGADGTISVRDDGSGWRADTQAPAGPAGDRPPQALTIDVVTREKPDRHYRFHVAQHREDQPFFKRVGALVVWYTHRDQDRVAQECVGPVLVAMRQLGDRPPSAQSLEDWRVAIEGLADEARLRGRLDWTFAWNE